MERASLLRTQFRLVDLLVATGAFPSETAARKFASQGGIKAVFPDYVAPVRGEDLEDDIDAWAWGFRKKLTLRLGKSRGLLVHEIVGREVLFERGW